MRLQSLLLKEFRTYQNLNLDFDRRLIFITGKNASGKTNILEALSILSMGRSFRGAMDRDIVREGSSDFFISCKYERAGKFFNLDYGCEISQDTGRSRKRIRLNGKQISGRSELIGNLITVVFSPSDIMIVDGGPSYRRRFLDALLSSQNRVYLENLVSYHKALRQRNSLLKKIRSRQASQTELDIWNSSVVRHGEKIIQYRIEFIENFKDIFHESIKRISGRFDSTRLELQFSRPGEEKDLSSVLKANAMADIASGHSLVGPHRHNLLFLSGGKDISITGSQGQKRSVVLALRIAEFYYLKKSLKLSPLLLIDDVIRELDAVRREAFVQLLHECGQALFTTPDLDGLESFLMTLKNDSSILNVEYPGLVRVGSHGGILQFGRESGQ